MEDPEIANAAEESVKDVGEATEEFKTANEEYTKAKAEMDSMENVTNEMRQKVADLESKARGSAKTLVTNVLDDINQNLPEDSKDKFTPDELKTIQDAFDTNDLSKITEDPQLNEKLNKTLQATLDAQFDALAKILDYDTGENLAKEVQTNPDAVKEKVNDAEKSGKIDGKTVLKILAFFAAVGGLIGIADLIGKSESYCKYISEVPGDLDPGSKVPIDQSYCNCSKIGGGGDDPTGQVASVLGKDKLCSVPSPNSHLYHWTSLSAWDVMANAAGGVGDVISDAGTGIADLAKGFENLMKFISKYWIWVVVVIGVLFVLPFILKLFGGNKTQPVIEEIKEPSKEAVFGSSHVTFPRVHVPNVKNFRSHVVKYL